MISEREYDLIYKRKKGKNLFTRFVKYLFLFSGLFLIFYILLNSPAIYDNIFFNPSGTIVSPLTEEPTVETVATKPAPVARVYIPDLQNNYIAIPALSITAPINWNVPLDQIYQKLESGIVHLETTAFPDQIGNIFIFGHSSNYVWAPGNYNYIFSVLPNIKLGQDIVINYNNQQFLYRVSETKVVNPKDISVLMPTEKPTLTLMTCVPVGTSLNRFIVHAQLVEGLVYIDNERENLQLEYLPKVL